MSVITIGERPNLVVKRFDWNNSTWTGPGVLVDPHSTCDPVVYMGGDVTDGIGLLAALRVRERAIATVHNLLKQACSEGFAGVPPSECNVLVEHALRELRRNDSPESGQGQHVAWKLCAHLRAAVNQGVFTALPDF